MKGVYFKRDDHSPWVLLGMAKTMPTAETLMSVKAESTRVGVFVYLEGANLLDSVWSLKTLGKTSLLCRRAAKSFLVDYKRIRYHQRKHWVRHDPNQISFQFVKK